MLCVPHQWANGLSINKKDTSPQWIHISFKISYMHYFKTIKPLKQKLKKNEIHGI